MVMVMCFPCPSQSGHPRFCLKQVLLLLLLDQSWSTVPQTRFGAFASSRLVLVVWVVFLVLQPQPLCLLDERPLLCFREKPIWRRGASSWIK